jgi:hypothetical protein
MFKRRKDNASPKKPSPPTSGLAIAGGIWVWGAMVFYAPTYFGIAPGVGRVVSNVLGTLLIAVSLAGALIELSKLWRNEALSYWGAGLVFLLPALGLQLVIIYRPPTRYALEIAAKAGVYILVFFGAPFLFLGIPYLFWKPDKKETTQEEPVSTSEMKTSRGEKRGKETLKTMIALFIVLLNLTTAIIKFVTAVIP